MPDDTEPTSKVPGLDRRLLEELEPEAGRLLDRHLKVAQEWFPHDYIPYRLGRDFDTEPWTPDQPRLTGVAQTAFEINLLTEDNLPSYHRLIHGMFGRGDGAWLTWVGRWTAEEGRHAIVLRDYLTVTRNIDPVLLERGRMNQLERGYDMASPDTLHGLAYVAFQELATRISHRNTGRYSDDPVADRIMVRIAADENLHMIFYRDILKAALAIEPSAAVRAIADEVLALQDAGRRHPELPAQGRRHREGRHLRPARAPRRGPAPDPQVLGRVRARPAWMPLPRRRGAGWRSTWTSWTWPPGGSRSASPARPSRGSHRPGRARVYPRTAGSVIRPRNSTAPVSRSRRAKTNGRSTVRLTGSAGAAPAAITTAVAAAASVPFSSTSMLAWWTTAADVEPFLRRHAREVGRVRIERGRHSQRREDITQAELGLRAELREAQVHVGARQLSR